MVALTNDDSQSACGESLRFGKNYGNVFKQMSTSKL